MCSAWLPPVQWWNDMPWRCEQMWLHRLLGVPLLPLRWQLRLGGHVPQRLPVQAAIPKPVLPNSAPEEALSDTALASQQQQWQDGLDLTEQAQEPNQTPEAQQQQPTDRRDEVAQVTFLRKLTCMAQTGIEYQVTKCSVYVSNQICSKISHAAGLPAVPVCILLQSDALCPCIGSL